MNLKLLNLDFLLLCSLAALAGCGDKIGGDPGPTDSEKTEVSVDGDMVIVHPLSTDVAFRNPMMGWRDVFSPGLDPIPANYPLPFGSVYKEYIPWNSIENNASDGVDKIIEFCNRRWKDIEKKNVKVIPRVYVHWLGTPPVSDPDRLDGIRFPADIPYDYDPADPYPMTGGYFDPTFQDRVRSLVAKLGQAWDNDPRVAYVEMGIIGQWGEQHSPMITTFWAPHDRPEHEENVTWIPGIEKTLGDAFTEAFKNKKVMVRYAYEFQDYQFGYYWDSWGVAEEQERGYGAMKAMGDRWKTHPYGGEICWNWGDLARYGSLAEMLANEETRNKIIAQIRELHANHLGYFTYARPTVDFSSAELAANARLVQSALGYRFVLDEFAYSRRLESGSKFNVSFIVRNEGSSPFYYDWPIEIALLDKQTREKVWSSLLEDQQISRWFPGDNWSRTQNRYQIPAESNKVSATLVLGEDVPDGEYIISVAVVDPAGNMPSLRFATSQYFTGGRHPMGYVGVDCDVDDYAMPISGFDNIYTDTTLHYIVE